MLRNSWHFFSIPLISGQHAKLASRWFIVVYINIALINMHFAVDDIDTESFSFHFRSAFQRVLLYSIDLEKRSSVR